MECEARESEVARRQDDCVEIHLIDLPARNISQMNERLIADYLFMSLSRRVACGLRNASPRTAWTLRLLQLQGLPSLQPEAPRAALLGETTARARQALQLQHFVSVAKPRP